MAHLIARETFHVATKTGLRTIQAGQSIVDTDPVVKAVPSMFQTPEQMAAQLEEVTFGPEQATAAPGETRSVRLRKG
jgi:hypothetical protein